MSCGGYTHVYSSVPRLQPMSTRDGTPTRPSRTSKPCWACPAVSTRVGRLQKSTKPGCWAVGLGSFSRKPYGLSTSISTFTQQGCHLDTKMVAANTCIYQIDHKASCMSQTEPGFSPSKIVLQTSDTCSSLHLSSWIFIETTPTNPGGWFIKLAH